MTSAVVDEDTLSDAERALALFIDHPHVFGGIVLRGDGPARDAMLDGIRSALSVRGPVIRIPVAVDADRLLGGLDLLATLAAGRGVMRAGLLDSARGGVIIVPMAERMAADVAAHLAQALDGGDVAMVLLDDGQDADEAPLPVLMDRIAFHCIMPRQSTPAPPRGAALAGVKPLSDDQLGTIAATAAAVGIGSIRAPLFAQTAARAHAAWCGRGIATGEDLAAAMRLVLAPRATQMPQAAPPPDAEAEAEAPPPLPDPGESEATRKVEDIDLDDIMLAAAAAAIPPHILDQIDQQTRRGGKGQSGRAGAKQKSAQRGRPLGSRAGVPGYGKRLALIDSLRAAAPWQTIRRQAAPDEDVRKIHIRKSDLRVRRFEQRSESLTIFAVDASGSSALSRLAEAKGAVELMLAQAYIKRAQVALIAFRHQGAEILLPPTRSLTRARRALSALPGGGGTPLADGLLAARHLAEAATKRGQTPTLAILTDGKANVDLSGTANRQRAMDDAHQAARHLAGLGLNSIVIDISPRPRPEAADLAAALNGRYLPLPQAHSGAMVKAIEGLNP